MARPKKPVRELPELPSDYDTRTYAPKEIVPARLIPLNKRSKHRKHVPSLGDPIPPSMQDGVHYRWDGEDFIAVPPQTGGPWHVATVVPQGYPVFYNDAG